MILNIINRYIFLLLFFIGFLFFFSKEIFSQNNTDNLVEINIITKKFTETYYVNFSSVDSPNSFQIYDD